MINAVPASENAYLDSLKGARNSPAVLKAQLVTLKSSLNNPLILVFEGVDDKVVYHHWLNKIDHKLMYEPFICRGKKVSYSC